MKSPIFLFSLPRSGSTLLQRVLMSHSDIASVAEPWILLPFVYAYKREGVLTEYSHKISYSAISDFIDNLPRKYDDYHHHLKGFIESLYSMQCIHNEMYFLDKTPRYYNIIPEIVKIFPDAKFIFLFRNPVHIMSSMIETWSSGNLRRLYAYDRDLNFGMKALSKGYVDIKERSCAINYEDFVSEPLKQVQKICSYLNIEFEKNMLQNFSTQKPRGKEGDPTGIKQYQNIDKSPTIKWKKTFNTMFRKKLLYRYILKLNAETLKTQGYDKDQILHEISDMKTDSIGLIKDPLDYLFSNMVKILKLNIWFLKHTSYWAKNRFIS